MEAQNLLLNGSFEEIRPAKGKSAVDFYSDNYYANYWFAPTDCSVDIYRDFKVCDDNHVKNIENGADFCVQTAAGDYCLGLYSITEYGYMEHITGTLEEQLEKDATYEISFALRFYGDKPVFSKGFGYKFSIDSFIFDSKIKMWNKLSPFYQDLFGQHKVKADFKFDEYLTDSTWNRFTTYYTAKGGERFLTFGQFPFLNDENIIRQVNFLRKASTQDKRTKFIESGKIEFLKKFDSIIIKRNNNSSINYYLLDDVRVEKVTDSKKIQEQSTCDGCIDFDPLTLKIPNRRTIDIDRGFEGDMTFTLDAQLQPLEKFVIDLDKGNRVIVFNEDVNKSAKLNYQFKYPAKKIRGKTIAYAVEKTTVAELKNLESSCAQESYQSGLFKGKVFKCKK